MPGFVAPEDRGGAVTAYNLAMNPSNLPDSGAPRRRLYRGDDPARAQNIAELRAMAARRLPNFCLEYLEGGADDELALARNRRALDDILLLPRTLVDVSQRDLSVPLFEVPTQSLPVSPPPITTTFFPVANRSSFRILLSIEAFANGSLPATRLLLCFRKSMAKCTPSSSRPGIKRFLGVVLPPASTMALYSLKRSLILTFTPTFARHLNTTPSSSMNFILRSTTHFSSLKSGIP